MKKVLYSNKLRYLAIVLVCVFAVLSAAGFAVTGLSWWWDRKQAEPYVQKRMEVMDDYTSRVMGFADAIVRNKDNGAFYFETDLGFVTVEELLVRAAWKDDDGDVTTEDIPYSLNTSGGKMRYVQDNDKSDVLNTDSLKGIIAVGLRNGQNFLLNESLLKKYGLDDDYVTDYVYYSKAIDAENILSAQEYFERSEGEMMAKEAVPESEVSSDEQKLIKYVEAITAGSGMDFPVAVAATIIMLLLAVYVVASAGHFGDEEIRLTVFDRCGFSLLVITLVGLGVLGCIPADVAFEIYRFGRPWMLLGFATFAVVLAVLCTGWIIESFAVRLKAHMFWRTTTIYYIFDAVKKPIVRSYFKIKDERMTYKEETNGLAKIIDETEKIVTGECDLVGKEGVYERYHPLVDSINAIAQGKSNAVLDKLNSDRMRTELITNVSHDIKTPLTSIISYVELLEKEGKDPEKSAEYVEVLKRQSLRLKNLLEDLIEASKASAGVLPVNKEELRLGVIVNQVLAEYDERLSAKKLSVVTKVPEEEDMITTDGRHLSRVIENLLSNIVKYSLEGTRVYIDVDYNEIVSGSKATITFKNTSASQLNISSTELMERFVRGDESRKTDGSGLGLSIAGSLMKVLGGDLDIAIDGDLFKATIIL